MTFLAWWAPVLLSLAIGLAFAFVAGWYEVFRGE